MMTKMKLLGGHLFLILAFILLPNISKAYLLVPYVYISGIVKDSITNEPIPEAEISFKPTWDPFDEWSSYFRYSSDDWITDENGKYSWHLHFPPNTTDIIAKAEGYQESRLIDVELPLYTEVQVDFILEKEEKKIDPVILIPGIMGSYDVEIRGWSIDPIMHTYDNLVEAMVKSGYKLNKTLFLLPYNWEKNNIETADLLKQKIAEIKTQTGTSKVDIVAHSMGGLIARYYVESSDYNNDVDQLIFLASPHQGSPESYLTYEGAYFLEFDFIKKFIFQIEATQNGYLSLSKYIRENVLSVGQLLPNNNYLQDKVGKEWKNRIYPINYPQNSFLEVLNSSQGIENLKQRARITNIYSYDGINSANTLEFIKVVPDPNIYDSKWFHGYPENLDDGNSSCLVGGQGDGTVPTQSSAFLDGVDSIEIMNANHREIVTQSQKHIIKILTGKQPENFYEKWSTLKRILFIRVYSPVDFMVVAPNNDKVGKDFLNNKIVNEIEGAFYSGFNKEAEFVTIINPEKGDYEIKLQGIDNGSYKLGIDILNDNNLKETKENLISGIISLGKEEIFTFNYIENNNEQNIIIEKKVSFNSIIQDIEELYQNKEIKKSFIKKSLKRQFKNLERKYNKIEKIKKSYHKKILKKYIQKSLNFAKRKLKFYLKQNWITQTAYDILINDIDNLIIKIK